MLPTKEELTQQYRNVSDHKLLDILYNKEEYRPEAFEAATEELNNRNISVEKSTRFLQDKKEKKIQSTAHANIPLPLPQKLLFFFAWFIPFFFGSAFQLNYREDGMTKKLKQSRLYAGAGFVSLILTTILTISLNLGNVPSFVILAGLFCVVLVFEKYILP